MLVAAAVAGVVVSTATAATRIGTSRAEIVRGTPRADFIDPRGGRDRAIGGSGADRIKAFDGFVDDVRCGPGTDVVAADLGDRVRADCETVSRRLAVDRLSDPTFRHATHVEPDSFAHGSTLVAVYQVGRVPRPGGGAAANGFSTTTNGGRTWRSGLLPALTVNNRPAGPWARASDPVIGYDERHGVWLASSLAISANASGLTFHRSTDGVTWSEPIHATRVTGDLGVDKQWFACDNWEQSPFYGRCYLAYTDIRRDRISMQHSSDGGLTWSEPIGSPDAAGRDNRQSPGVQPVVRPNGELLILFLDENRMAALRSSDGGQTLSRTQVIAPAAPTTPPRFRAFALAVAEVGADGTVYLAWMNCTPGCDGSDLVLVRSADGVSWTRPARLPLGPRRVGRYFVLPGLAADPARAGRLALAYYRIQPSGAIDAFFVSSRSNGARWTSPRRLTPESVRREWLVDTQYGPMLGDYISTSFVSGRPIPILIVAGRPRGGRLDEAVFAALVR